MPGVTIILDEATPLLAGVRTLAQAQGLALVGARAAAIVVRQHLYGLDAQRHKYGSHFYRQAGDSVSTGIAPQGAVVSINHQGFRQRLQGGRIAPGLGKKYLTLPASPEAQGKRAGEFAGLRFAIVPDQSTAGGTLRPALVRDAQTEIRISKRKKKDGTFSFTAKPVRELHPEVMFWLVRSVTQRADPSVLPYDEQLASAATGAISARFTRLALRRARAAGYEPDPEDLA